MDSLPTAIIWIKIPKVLFVRGKFKYSLLLSDIYLMDVCVNVDSGKGECEIYAKVWTMLKCALLTVFESHCFGLQKYFCHSITKCEIDVAGAL